MITSLSINDLGNYTSKQLNHFFPDNDLVDLAIIKSSVQMALDKLEFCYQKVKLTHYFDGKDVLFNHLYSDQYVMYIWHLANILWHNTGNKSLCNKLYYLNKALHGLDCMFDTQLPDIFLIFHGVGTMLGKAIYSDYFVALQGCTVGMNRGKYPVIGKGVSLTAHSSIIGDCEVGNHVTIASHTNVFDKNIDSDTVVYRNDKGVLEFKATQNSYARQFFIDI